jgi:parallel beta-helix repeat protein
MENLITVSKKRPVSFSRKGSDYVNLRSLFLIFVVMVMMCGSASATIVNCSADTMVSSFRSGTFGSNEFLPLDYSSSGNSIALYRFVIPDFPEGESIENATLYIYFDTWDTSGARIDDIDNNTWNEYSTDWETRPFDATYVTTSSYSPVTSTGESQYIGFGVTDLITSGGTYSFILSPQYGDWFTVLSRESTFVPYIEFNTYTKPSGEFYINNSHPSASDSNVGTSDLPFETINGALSIVNSNSILHITGTYNEAIDISGFDNLTLQSLGECYLYSSDSDGTIKISGTYNTTLNGLSVFNNVGDPLRFSNDAGEYLSANNCIFNTTSGRGIYFETSSNFSYPSFTNCYIRGYGPAVSIEDYANIYNITCNYNEIISDASHGVFIGEGSGSGYEILHNVVNSSSVGIFSDVQTSGTYPTNINSQFNIVRAGLSTSGASGIYLRAMANSTVSNNIVLNSTYTGIKFNYAQGYGHSNHISNNTVIGNGYDHNAFETKGNNTEFSHNHVYGYVADGNSYNVYYGAGDQQEHDIWVHDCYANDTRDVLTLAGAYQENVTFANITATNHSGRAIAVYGSYFSSAPDGNYETSNNLIFDNYQVTIGDTSDRPILILSPGTSKNAISKTDYANYTRDNIFIIDENITGFSTPWHITDSGTYLQHHLADIFAINPQSEATYWYTGNETMMQSVLHFGYYANIKVVDIEGNPIPNAALTFASNVTNPETGTTLKPHNLDYHDTTKMPDELDIAYTNSNGLTDNRFENKSNVVALTSSMKYWDTSMQTDYVEWNVTATYDGTSNSTIITPDMLVYSPDSSNIQSDLVTLTLDVTVSEDHDNEYVAVVFAGLSFVGLYFANRFRRR